MLLSSRVRLTNVKSLKTLKSLRMASTSGYAADDVLFHNENMARVITLNRVNKLNSLNTSMVSKIIPRLVEYAKLDVSNMVILTSNSPKALCAGGDVAECAAQILKGNPGYASDFFQKEYNMNYLIATYSKPYVALMDGITMGGGVGLSVHAPFRIATEKTKLAMPEMDIGFFPDVGTTFFLPRLDDKLGYYYALTGEILSGLDAYMAGFATHYLPSERVSQLVQRLSNLNPPVINGTKDEASVLRSQKDYFAQVNEVISEFAETKLPQDYKFHLSAEETSLINQAFSKPSFDEVLATFKNAGTDFGTKTFERLSAKSPTCVRVAFELMNKGAKSTIRNQLELELITATNMMNAKLEENDFVKGVKHKLIDKIKEPNLPEWTTFDAARVEKLQSKSIYTAKLPSPLLENFFGVNFNNYIFNMGLPSNSQIEDYITGRDGSNRSYLPTPNEVFKHFKQLTNNKLGVEEKVARTLAVHGEASKYDNKYVSWKA
ncbi:CIC11C00000002101 [Sungouiella intermedia]|uniref:3-hydroxyisobutyryl-CoA hydrolase n=1 Tax=Sungouiella intermedia TaxID=45354 RepID=A0A1L0BYW2_9ASCO|nr:CIC11C00000002101 [[Candida] intermedia]